MEQTLLETEATAEDHEDKEQRRRMDDIRRVQTWAMEFSLPQNLNITPLDVAKTLAYFHGLNGPTQQWTAGQITNGLRRNEPKRFKGVKHTHMLYYVANILNTRPNYFVRADEYERYALRERPESPFNQLLSDARAASEREEERQRKEGNAALQEHLRTVPNHWKTFDETKLGRNRFYKNKVLLQEKAKQRMDPQQQQQHQQH